MSGYRVVRGRASDVRGRWDRLRPYSTVSGFGLPILLDRKWGTLSPFPDGVEWVRDRRRGLWVPGISGGAFSSGAQPMITLPEVTPGSLGASTIALNTDYVFGTSGDNCGGVKFSAFADKTVDKVYAYLSAVAGTAANVDDILLELRNDNGTSGPGSTVHTSTSINPNDDASATGWHAWDVADYTLTAGTPYWVLVADPDGNATDYATLQVAPTSYASGATTWYPWTSTSGGASPSSVTHVGCWVLVMSDGTVWGSGLVTSATTTNNTYRRGLYLSGLTAPVRLAGCLSSEAASAAISGIELYDGTTAPGGTPLRSGSATLRYAPTSSTFVGGILTTPYTLQRATAYRLVFTFGSGTTTPRKHQCGTANGHETVLREAKPGGSGWYYAYANGTTDWSNDDQNATAAVVLLLEDLWGYPNLPPGLTGGLG